MRTGVLRVGLSLGRFVPGPDQVMVPPETITRQTPYGEIHRLAPQVKLSKTPGRWRDPLVAVRGGDRALWQV